MASFYLLGNATNSQMFGCVIQTKNKTIVIDGGTVGDCQQLVDFLKEKADSHVDAWFFTHPHHDHIGAFLQLAETDPTIQIDNIYHHFSTMDQLEQYGKRSDGETLLWKRLFSLLEDCYASCVTVLQQGDCFVFDDVTITVLRIINESIIDDFVNNSSTVYRIDSPRHSILILGDIGVKGGEDLLQRCDCNRLHTDYTQMAHHGQGGVNQAFYDTIRPQRCLWPCPAWLWDNDAGNGFDTGPFNTVRTREWVAALGVTEHYVAKDGTLKIEF